jgi:DNA-binding MarR family transcriptional regulator
MTIESIKKSTMSPAKKAILNILITQNRVMDRFNDILKPFEISSEQFNVLRILRGQKGNPANMCLIQENMIAKTSNTTRLVDKLLIKELVTRKVCSENRRKIDVSITQNGLNLLLKLDPIVIDHENSFAHNLNEDELLQFNLLIEKYRNEHQ